MLQSSWSFWCWLCFNCYNIVNFILDVGIFFHCLRCHIRMDGHFIRTLSCDPFYLQLNQKTLCEKCEKWRWRHWSSINFLPQGNSKNPFIWSSWYFLFLPGSTDSALSFGLPMSWIHHIPQSGVVDFLQLFWTMNFVFDAFQFYHFHAVTLVFFTFFFEIHFIEMNQFCINKQLFFFMLTTPFTCWSTLHLKKYVRLNVINSIFIVIFQVAWSKLKTNV